MMAVLLVYVDGNRDNVQLAACLDDAAGDFAPVCYEKTLQTRLSLVIKRQLSDE